MQVATWPQVFGRAGDPGVQVALPITIADGQSMSAASCRVFQIFYSLTLSTANHDCAVSIDIDGPPIASQWYDLWADAVAVTGVCVVRGKWGASTIQGTLATSSLEFKLYQ